MELINFTNTITRSVESVVEEHDKIMNVINKRCYDKFNSFTDKYLLDVGDTEFTRFWERIYKQNLSDDQILALGSILEGFEQPMNSSTTNIPMPCGVLLDKHCYREKVDFIKSLGKTLINEATTFTLNARKIVDLDIAQATSMLFEFTIAVLKTAQNRRIILLIQDIDLFTIVPDNEPNKHFVEISETFFMIYTLLLKNIQGIILFGFYNDIYNVSYELIDTFDYIISKEI